MLFETTALKLAHKNSEDEYILYKIIIVSRRPKKSGLKDENDKK